MDKKYISAGLLAHVDAGKTTLAEGILYLTGSIRSLGRVDHQNAFLDNFAMERERGITIFSKQARLRLGELELTLVDTPGHVDFSAEMERTLGILDYAVLVVSGADGVQSHVETLWSLLKRYQIPVFLFVNKMDQPGTNRERLLVELQKRLDERCMDFGAGRDETEFYESLALGSEEVLEEYLESGTVSRERIAELIRQRKVFPCFFGSALKLEGVEELLEGMRQYCEPEEYGTEFGARVYKISRDEQGNRLTHLKITGGKLKVKELLSNERAEPSRYQEQESKNGTGTDHEIRAGKRKNQSQDVTGCGSRDSWRDGLTGSEARAARENFSAMTVGDNREIWKEKVDQIRIYSGASFETVNEAEAGVICAVTGFSRTYVGEGLGMEGESPLPVLEPVLSYAILLPPECDVHQMYRKLLVLEEEEPQLHIAWNEQNNEICAQLMGEVQIEVLKRMIKERFGVLVEFGPGSILYKETIEAPVVGLGHFEPLRHYAEVHLLLEPGERGSGLQFATVCSEDVLDRNWQRLILTHLEEKKHRGVLTGAEITDMKITLLAGRAHIKHTEGGDFRQATYRAVRQGLKRGKSLLLEPVYQFRMEIPAETAGRAMTDIQRMCGTFSGPELEEGMAVLTGSAPVVTMQGYQTELLSYTKGRGRLFCSMKGYEPCHNAEEVITNSGYDSESDLDNPTGSVFCAHGAGFVVNWELVPEYVHLDVERAVPEDARLEPGDAGEASEQLCLNPGNTGEVSEQLHLENIGEISEAKGRRSIRREVPSGSGREINVTEKELEEIFTRTYGQTKRETNGFKKSRRVDFGEGVSGSVSKKEPQEEYLLVDGYNIIFAWEELQELAKVNIDSARTKLMDILCNYQGYKKMHLILVFDAYRVEGGQGSVQKYHNIYVVYTKEAETADQYIEKTVHQIGRKYQVTVATSDALEQVIILGQGGTRLSANGLREEILLMEQEIRQNYMGLPESGKHYLFDHLPTELTGLMEEVRLGKKKLK